MMDIKIVKQGKASNFFYHTAGFAILLLNKLRRSVTGYTGARNFPVSDFKQAIEYDFSIVGWWIDFLKIYTGEKADLKGKIILELGPGDDLGIGLITLMKGAKKYNAMDVNYLVKAVPEEFYDKLFDHMKTIDNETPDINFLKSQIELTRKGKNDRLNYVCRADFDLSIFRDEGIDLVLSQAAFEHFEDVAKTIAQLSKVVKSRAMLITTIDLMSHTKLIRDSDPLNIYRFSDFTYRQFKHAGLPNRLRPFEYVELLEKSGWYNIKTLPLITLDEESLLKVQPSLSKRFRGKENQMEYLSFLLCATKK